MRSNQLSYRPITGSRYSIVFIQVNQAIRVGAHGAAESSIKEVIQPQVPLRLPCYDLVPITEFTFGACSLAVSSATSDAPHFRGLTGGVYKAQEHIHRGVLTRDY